MAPPSPGADRPDQTTGARRRVTVPTTGMRAVSADAPPVSREMRGDCAFCAEGSCTRKLAWLTMTCAGSQWTFTMLSGAGVSSNPDERPPVGVRGVLVSTLI